MHSYGKTRGTIGKTRGNIGKIRGTIGKTPARFADIPTQNGEFERESGDTRPTGAFYVALARDAMGEKLCFEVLCRSLVLFYSFPSCYLR